MSTEAWVQQANENVPAWLSATRKDALHAFLNGQFPSQHRECWKYTALSSLTKTPFTQDAPSVSVDSLSFLPEMDRCVFIDGQWQPSLSELPKGVEVSLLSQMTSACAEQTFSSFSTKTDALHLLNTALTQDGFLIHVSSHQRVERPLHCLFITTQGQSHGSHFLSLGASSELTLFIEVLSASSVHSASMTSNLTVSLAPGAQLKQWQLHGQKGEHHCFSRVHARVEKDACYQVGQYHLGDAHSRSEFHIELGAPGAQVKMDGLYCPTGRAHCDQQVYIDHLASHTHSALCFRGIAADQGKGIYHGHVHVHPKAQHITSHQKNDNLQLSPQSEIATKPVLEIDADDVSCSHGATVGFLDEEALFYLRSRGIDEATARNVLLHAFCQPMLDAVAIDGVKAEIQSYFNARLTGLTGVGFAEREERLNV